MNLEDRVRNSLRSTAKTMKPSARALAQIERRLKGSRSAVSRAAIAIFTLALFGGSLTFLVAAFASKNATRRERVPAAPIAEPRITARVNVGMPLADAATGTDRVWVAGASDAACSSLKGRLTSIDAATNSIDAEVSLDFAPTAIAAGLGSVWVGGYTCAEENGTVTFAGTVARIDVETNRVIWTRRLEGEEVGDIVVADAHVWAAIALTDPHASRLLALDPQNGSVVERMSVNGAIRDVISAGNYLWLSMLTAEIRGAGLMRIDPSTDSIVEVQGSNLTGPIVAGDGVIWSAGSQASGRSESRYDIVAVEVRISDASIQRTLVVDDPVFQPIGLDDGGLWFLGGEQRAEIARLDTETGEVNARLAVGDHHAVSTAMNVVTNVIWVAEDEDGSVLRIDLR
jgi:outer membrane protein assembly factor BamB